MCVCTFGNIEFTTHCVFTHSILYHQQFQYFGYWIIKQERGKILIWLCVHTNMTEYTHIHAHKWTTAWISIPHNPTCLFPETTDSIFGPGFHDKANVLFTQRCLGIKEACWDGPETAQLLNSPPQARPQLNLCKMGRVSTKVIRTHRLLISYWLTFVMMTACSSGGQILNALLKKSISITRPKFVFSISIFYTIIHRSISIYNYFIVPKFFLFFHFTLN